MDILYEYYKERYDSSKHHKFLHPQEFFQALQMWNAMGIPAMMDAAITHFDEKFGVAKLFNKEGNLIRVA
jgi:hypothetical protein